MESLNKMRNLYLPDGSWAGQFMDEATAKAWATKNGYNLSECEISTRKVDRGDYRKLNYPSVSNQDFEAVSDDVEEQDYDYIEPEPKTVYSALTVSELEAESDEHLMQFIDVIDRSTIKKVLD